MGLHLREAGMTYRITVGDSRPNIGFVELEGDGSRPLLQLRADLRGPSRNPLKDVRLYVVVRMTSQEMADLLPHRAERATSAENVQMWGIYVQSTAVWAGIRNWRKSPLRSFLLPHVADSVADHMDAEGTRELLHFTGFLDRNADAIETMRFFAQARHS